MLKKVTYTSIMLLILVSCATPEQLINQNVIYKGMSKSSLFNAMVDMNIGDDITLGGCYRDYYPETQYEILGSSSRYAWYVFKEVTVPAAVSNCSYQGNGILEGVFASFADALNYVQKGPQIAENSPSKEEPVSVPDEENELIPFSNGTGFFVNTDAYLVSNYHVVEKCQYVGAAINGELLNVRVMASDIVNDLIVGKVENLDQSSYLPLSMEGAYLGDNIIAAGYPLADKLSDSLKVTRGIVSSMSGMNNNYSEYQIDAAVQDGNSGGPLIDNSGNVVGVVVSQLNKYRLLVEEETIPENVNFAIKSQNLENFLKANNIEYETKRSGNVIQNRLVAKSAQDATMMLLCFNTIANLKQMYGEKNVSRIFTLKDSKIK